MRHPVFISPTQLMKWLKNPDEYYIEYLSDWKPPKIPQTQPMSVGSAFDAIVKSYLYKCLVGDDADYSFDNLFTKQVEEQNRDFARQAGLQCFAEYQSSGALARLLSELSKSISEPRFETEIRMNVTASISSAPADLIILTKPDVFFINEAGVPVVYDWKVNGYCSKSGVSPKKRYALLLPDAKTHKEYHGVRYAGMEVNINGGLEDVDVDWGTQLAMYAWSLGCDIGSKFIVGIDQLACRMSTIKVAIHRHFVTPEYQYKIFNLLCEMWEVVHSDHIFRGLSKEESQAKCKELDTKSRTLLGEGTAEDQWFAQQCREGYGY